MRRLLRLVFLLIVLRGCIVVWLSEMRWEVGWEEVRGVVVVSCATCWVGGIVFGSCERGSGSVVSVEIGSGGGVMCGVCAILKYLTTCDGNDGDCCVPDGGVSMAASVLRCLGLALLRLFN